MCGGEGRASSTVSSRSKAGRAPDPCSSRSKNRLGIGMPEFCRLADLKQQSRWIIALRGEATTTSPSAPTQIRFAPGGERQAALTANRSSGKLLRGKPRKAMTIVCFHRAQVSLIACFLTPAPGHHSGFQCRKRSGALHERPRFRGAWKHRQQKPRRHAHPKCRAFMPAGPSVDGV